MELLTVVALIVASYLAVSSLVAVARWLATLTKQQEGTAGTDSSKLNRG